MMPSTSKSKSYRRKGKFVPKPKQVWRVKQPTRNWLELPSDLMVNILQRVSVFDRLENAQKVCTLWRAICKDPAMWRVINMDNNSSSSIIAAVCRKMCKHAVDRSQGQLVELTMVGFCDDDLLQFVADRASQLKRLEIVYYFDRTYEIWSEALKKFSSLEELSLVKTNISVEHIEAAGRYCPLLKTLKLNQFGTSGIFSSQIDEHDDEFMTFENKIALAIGKNLPELTHLELIGNCIENIGLQAILNGCSHLDSLDLRRCLCVDLQGELGKRCSKQIKNLKLPHDSLQESRYADLACDDFDDSEDESLLYLDSDDEYRYFDDYDYDDVRFDEDGCPIIEDLNDWMAFKAMIE